MKKFDLFFFCILFSIALSSLLGLNGCANIIPPGGGPRDSIPPMLINANPKDSSTNFSSDRIVLTFNEFVELQNQQNIIFSPTPDFLPQYDFRLRSITVRLKDTLASNTTYIIQFGNAIKDFNEGNVAKNFTYTFSTGPYIDSLEIKGNVLIAETGKSDSTLIALLYSVDEDSAVIKRSPKYITRLDGSGNFKFKNLPPQQYHLFVLKDDNGNRRYEADTELFGFHDVPVPASKKDEMVTLYAFKAIPKLPQITPQSPISQLKGQDVKELRFASNLVNNKQDLLDKLNLTFNNPIRSLDTNKMLLLDSNFQKLTGYNFTLDTSRTKAIMDFNWVENNKYHLILNRGFVEDTSGGVYAKTDTLSFQTKKKNEYGELKLRFRNYSQLDNPALQILQAGMVIQVIPISQNLVTFPLFKPGEYELRVFMDANKNGEWDTGDFFNGRKQPEKVIPINKKLSVRASWENEIEISL